MRRFVPVALLCLALSLGCSKSEKSSQAVTAAPFPDAQNATYLINGKAITLSNGKADEPAAPGSASRNVTTLTTLSATGDVDGDNKPDLAVVLTNSPGGSGTFIYLAVLASSETSPAKTALIGDRISVSQISIKDASLTVSYLTRPEGAPFSATPSIPVSKTFHYSEGQLFQN